MSLESTLKSTTTLFVAVTVAATSLSTRAEAAPASSTATPSCSRDVSCNTEDASDAAHEVCCDDVRLLPLGSISTSNETLERIKVAKWEVLHKQHERTRLESFEIIGRGTDGVERVHLRLFTEGRTTVLLDGFGTLRIDMKSGMILENSLSGTTPLVTDLMQADTKSASFSWRCALAIFATIVAVVGCAFNLGICSAVGAGVGAAVSTCRKDKK